MSINIYTVSSPLFVQYLTALSDIMDKAVAQAEAKKLDQSFLLNMRLYGDMFNFTRQVRASCNHAVNTVARLAGIEPPKFEDNEASFADLKTRIAKAVEFIKSVKPSQIEGSDDKEIIVKLPNGNERKYTGRTLLLNFCYPNFWFHVTTAYDILRHCGIEIGKRDYIGTPVG
jgi:hypothetical protein